MFNILYNYYERCQCIYFAEKKDIELEGAWINNNMRKKPNDYARTSAKKDA